MACAGSTCHTCGNRINWLISTGLSQPAAEQQVASEFPTECGACGGVPTCDSQWENNACAGSECFTCGARITYLMNDLGYSSDAARQQVADEFPQECGACGGGSGSTTPPAPTPPGPPAPTPVPQPDPYLWIRDIEQNGGVHYLEARTYYIDRQYQLPPNTEIHGAGSGSKFSGTVIEVAGNPNPEAICGANAINRQGFILGDNNYIGKLHYIGKDTKRFGDNQLLCGGAPFETPGCAGAAQYAEPPESCDGDLGSGQGVQNVTVEDVSFEEFTVQQLFFASPTKRGAKVSQNITVRNLRCNGTWADGINFHGAHRNILVEDCDIRNCGDDTYAIWSIGDLAENITFRNNVAVKPRYRPGCWSSWTPWKCDQRDAEDWTKQYCFAIYGGKTSAFYNNVCTDARDAVAYGNFQDVLFGGVFTDESASVVQGMAGYWDGNTCFFSQPAQFLSGSITCEA